jgi:hypothetical protein
MVQRPQPVDESGVGKEQPERKELSHCAAPADHAACIILREVRAYCTSVAIVVKQVVPRDLLRRKSLHHFAEGYAPSIQPNERGWRSLARSDQSEC